jgi:hypothetical protein
LHTIAVAQTVAAGHCTAGSGSLTGEDLIQRSLRATAAAVAASARGPLTDGSEEDAGLLRKADLSGECARAERIIATNVHLINSR